MVAPTEKLIKRTRVRISKSGQVTLPAKIRKQLGVEPGEHVEFEKEPDGKVVVKPVRILSVDDIAGKFGRAIDPEDLENALQDARESGAVRKRYKDGSVVDDLD